MSVQTGECTAVPESNANLKPPVATVQTVTHRNHGDERVDQYYWLRERDNPAVLAYLEAENSYTEAMLAHTEALQQTLYDEMKSRIKETDESVPVAHGGYFYYHREEEGKQYRIYCRKKGSLDADEQVLIDLNLEAEGRDYLRMGSFSVSPDHSLLAFALDTDGSETYTLQVKDLTTGDLLPDRIENTYYGLEWGNDNRTLYYTTLDPALRPHKLHRHRLGDPVSNDEVVYHEEDERFFLRLYKAKSERHIFFALGSAVTSEVYAIDAEDPGGQPFLIQPRVQDMEYFVTHHYRPTGEERFLILTNWEAENFRVMSAPVDAPAKENWQELIPHSAEVMLDHIEPFQDFLVVWERENGLTHIRIQDLQTGAFFRGEESSSHRVEQLEPVYTVSRGQNPDFNSQVLRYRYTSLVSPPTVFDYEMANRNRTLRKQDEVNGYDPAAYTTERIWAYASDGVQVPVSLVYPAELNRDGQNPCLLIGYGSYGMSYDPFFSSNLVSLLQRGFVVAYAHIRGGGEMGRQWKEDGKYLKKKNTFTDFIACAEAIIDCGYTSPRRLAISGRSAGGLLMGAVTNERPDLFAGVVAGVPFVDVVNTMLDANIPLTVIEWEEWGNPADPEYYHYMKSYSPYDNVEAKDYPAILATAGLNDPRVQYWEPAKWVAKLRACKTDDNPLLLKTEMGAGHFSKSGRYDYLEEVALEYAFILDTTDSVPFNDGSGGR
ncbi:MAG: S9 family peptidase [Caldilineaceae bacterium]|nr:S9 family peptidase [Caldilineaceae bacterium]